MKNIAMARRKPGSGFQTTPSGASPSASGKTDADKTKRAAPQTTMGSGEAAGDIAFQKWVDRGLHALYDGVVNEPLPPELVAIIRAAKPK